ncbi:hypothetical protein CDAR_305521 [Caerostris darwini]|uniref:Uncharacterized protein n=1 Tax=Caerostris darwini TaxID=1538125 RepID=A0AAV4MC97_9ARAC|nr:hypothetical protein CDAR_305521 [Caerostris darwini]
MNSDEIKHITFMIVNLYPKFVSWWTVLDATSRVLNSDFQSIAYYLKSHCRSRANVHRFKKVVTNALEFLNSTELVKDNLTSLTEEVTVLLKLSSSNNPVSEDIFFSLYDTIREMQEDLKEIFMDLKKHFKEFCRTRQKILDHFEEYFFFTNSSKTIYYTF